MYNIFTDKTNKFKRRGRRKTKKHFSSIFTSTLYFKNKSWLLFTFKIKQFMIFYIFTDFHRSSMRISIDGIFIY